MLTNLSFTNSIQVMDFDENVENVENEVLQPIRQQVWHSIWWIVYDSVLREFTN